jgi:hypothetical protein
MTKTLLSVVLALLLALPASAATNFPAALDDNTTLFELQTGDVYIASHHNNPKDAILALEAKVGVDGSAITTSLDYLVKNTGSVDPGHRHTGTSVSFSDGSAGTPGLRFGNPVTDTNTGLFHPAVGAVAVSASGTEVVRVVSTGVGVLTSGANGFPLEVGGAVRIVGASNLLFGGTGAADYDVTLNRTTTRTLRVFGTLLASSGATGDVVLQAKGMVGQSANLFEAYTDTAGTFPVVSINNIGVLSFGGGGISATDTTLYRATANVLKTDDSFAVAENTLALVNGANNDVTLPVGEYIRITGPTGAFSISGLTGGTGGRRVTLRSTVSQTLTITNLATSTAANQIDTLRGADIVCQATEQAAVTLIYDSTQSRWVVVGHNNCAAV